MVRDRDFRYPPRTGISDFGGFSLILGLALQDTLGNLFAGVALQLDKPYEIGDWIEISPRAQVWVGQVEEISWRATTMIGLFDELLVLRIGSWAPRKFRISPRGARRSGVPRPFEFRTPPISVRRKK